MEYPILDKIPLFPLIKNFRANNVFNAFILAALFQTILLSLTFSSQDLVEKYEINGSWRWIISIFYIFINYYYFLYCNVFSIWIWRWNAYKELKIHLLIVNKNK